VTSFGHIWPNEEATSGQTRRPHLAAKLSKRELSKENYRLKGVHLTMHDTVMRSKISLSGNLFSKLRDRRIGVRD
jgi:hypothetical protein